MSTANELLEIAKNELANLKPGEMFLVRDLFKGYEWNRISRSNRLLLGTLDVYKRQIKATVYIPAGKESYFINKVEAYATEQTHTGKPKNNDLIGSIEDVKLAMLDSFWIGEKKTMPTSRCV